MGRKGTRVLAGWQRGSKGGTGRGLRFPGARRRMAGLAMAGVLWPWLALAEGDPAAVQRHLAAARAAGADLQPFLALCREKADPVPDPASLHHSLERLMADSATPPGRAFDNLYYVGTTWVSAWALVTSEGIILIDALDNAAEARDAIEGGLRRLGLDPAAIRYVIVTHAHGDHYGGVDELVAKYHPRVVMSAADWDALERPPLQFDDALWGRPPRRDLAAKDGDRITLGDTTVDLVLTPGHTMGTLSPVFTVRDRGAEHRVVLWGGTGFNFGPNAGRFRAFIESTDRMRDMVRQQHIDVFLSNHPGFDGSIAKLRSLAARQPNQPNPYVVGEATLGRMLEVMGECGAANLASFDAAAVPGAAAR